MHTPDALQQAPHGVAEHEPPLDQNPLAAMHAFCDVNVHDCVEGLQHVPHGVLMQLVPAPAQNPAHELCATTVHVDPAQQAPLGPTHGLGEHAPGAEVPPAQVHSAGSVITHPVPQQHAS